LPCCQAAILAKQFITNTNPHKILYVLLHKGKKKKTSFAQKPKLQPIQKHVAVNELQSDSEPVVLLEHKTKTAQKQNVSDNESSLDSDGKKISSPKR
jgi:hypothetical protein